MRRLAALALAAFAGCALAADEAPALQLDHGQAACNAEVNRCIVRKDDLEVLIADHKLVDEQREEIARLGIQLKQLLEAKRGKLRVIPKSEMQSS